ncbi:hypothetical protein PENSPDRAFT_732413 [Peniophora sp. CONT]|nr:hypothetical protein PENSPDRAFT_732413 [Peniophora sp. CONT]
MDSGSKPSAKLSTTPAVKQEQEDPFDDEIFKFRTIVFVVGGKRFRVPVYGAPGIAAAFQERFLGMEGEENVTDAPGSSTENPIRLEDDVSDTDFASLIKATYPPPGYHAAPTLSFDEWMSVLKLSRKWNLAITREHALAGSDDIVQTKTPLEKILLGKKYKVSKWIEEGYLVLITRWDGLSEEEREELDAQTQLGIWRLRDRAWAGLLRDEWGLWPWQDAANQSNKQSRALGGGSGQVAAVREMFRDELKPE